MLIIMVVMKVFEKEHYFVDNDYYCVNWLHALRHLTLFIGLVWHVCSQYLLLAWLCCQLGQNHKQTNSVRKWSLCILNNWQFCSINISFHFLDELGHCEHNTFSPSNDFFTHCSRLCPIYFIAALSLPNFQYIVHFPVI